MIELFNDIYGQKNVKNILTNILGSCKIPHAFLFKGIEGCGKDFMALKLAEALNRKHSIPSGKNISQIISNYNEPYVKYIFPLPRGKNETDETGPIEKLSKDDIEVLQEEIQKKIINPYHKISLPKANNIKISSIRDIKKFISLNYDEIPYRVILISDAHLMNEEAQNALLKNLEEPPDGVIFILTTPYPDYLRETIRSRCWAVNFQPLSDDEISNILVKYYNVEEDLANELAPFSEGSVTNALNILEYDFRELKDKTIFILRYSLGKKYNSALNEFLPMISDANSEIIKIIVRMMIIWLNDLQKHRCDQSAAFYDSHKETLEKFNSKFPHAQLNEIVYKLEKLSAAIRSNINLSLIILNIIYELSFLTDTKQ
jgi:DNA polymerase III subunit delta'